MRVDTHSDMQTSLIFLAGFSFPLWWPSLRAVSDTSALLVPIAALGLIFLRMWVVARHTDEDAKLDRSEESSGTAAAVLSAGSKITAKFFMPLAIALGVLAVAAYFFPGKAQAAVLPASAAPATGARRKKADDDTGADGEADADESSADGPIWYRRMRSKIGLCERLPNGKSNPEVSAMYQAVGMKASTDARRVPWCAVGLNAVLDGVPGSTDPAYAGTRFRGTRSAMARSFNARTCDKLKTPRIGAIGTFWRGKYDDGESGHVALYAGETDTHWLILGCNQSDKICIEKMPKRRNGKATLLGWYWPRHRYLNKEVAAVAGKVAAAGGTGAVAANEAMSSPETVANLPPDVPGHPDIVATIDKVRAPVEQIGNILPDHSHVRQYILFACAGLGILAALVVLYQTVKPHPAP